MVQPSLSRELAEQAVSAVNVKLREGYRPRGVVGSSKAAKRAAADSLSIQIETFRGRLRAAKRLYDLEPDWSLYQPPEPEPEEVEEPVLAGQVEPRQVSETVVAAPRVQGGIHRYIVTCAQNNTKIHEQVWANLLALADHYGAQVLVSRFTYNKAEYLKRGNLVKPGAELESWFDDIWYDPCIQPYTCDVRTEIAPGLVFCGEINILPTAVRPLSGFESYTGRASGIFPHPRYAMESVASGKNEPTKFNWTTGTVTLRNYLAKKAGLRAEFHHAYGALLVEVDREGDWWVRQLNARDSDGTICDLDLKVENGKVCAGQPIEAVVWGDVHIPQEDAETMQASWGANGLLDTLKPRYQIIHDLVDFRARNHHERGNPHAMFQRFVEGNDDVAMEFVKAAEWLGSIAHRDWCQTVVVDSNHDRAAERWLREADYRADPKNALFFLHSQMKKYEAILHGNVKEFHLVEWALREYGCPPEVRFLREDESFVICPDANGGIECGIHGHLGPNGRRGTPAQFAKMGRKAITAHTHSAGIVDGVYTAGTSSDFDLGYNRGPSSWSHSHVVVYSNGKRAIVTVWDGKWRAEEK